MMARHRRVAGLRAVLLLGPRSWRRDRDLPPALDPRPLARGMLPAFRHNHWLGLAVFAGVLIDVCRQDGALRPAPAAAWPGGRRDPRGPRASLSAHARARARRSSRAVRGLPGARGALPLRPLSRLRRRRRPRSRPRSSGADLVVWLHPLHWYGVPGAPQALVRHGAREGLGLRRGRQRARGQGLPVGGDHRRRRGGVLAAGPARAGRSPTSWPASSRPRATAA